MSVNIGALLAVIIILISIAVLWRRLHRPIPLRTPEDLRRNRDESQAEFDDVEHDLARAMELLDQAHRQELKWAEACRQLGGWAKNPALADLVHTPDGDDPAAQDLFETAITKLKQAYAKARENLEMAQILVDDENEEA